MGRKPIIVSMTSWPKRIGNVATVVKSLLDQSLPPDIIEINLSKDEFPNREEDFPEDLKEVIKHEPRIDIEWVDGNDGVFKKIIPTIKKHYGEDYYLLSVDDDWVYSNDYIEVMYDTISQVECDTLCLCEYFVIGSRMIYDSRIFEPDFWEKLTPEVVSTRIDDDYIVRYLSYKNAIMASWGEPTGERYFKEFNPVFSNAQNDGRGYKEEDLARAKEIIGAITFEKRQNRED